VTNKGADSMQWECEYDTSQECASAVAGKRRLLRHKSVLATGAVWALMLARAFIDENGGGPGVRLRKRQQKKG
jgi:hypothetical protein